MAHKRKITRYTPIEDIPDPSCEIYEDDEPPLNQELMNIMERIVDECIKKTAKQKQNHWNFAIKQAIYGKPAKDIVRERFPNTGKKSDIDYINTQVNNVMKTIVNYCKQKNLRRGTS